MAAQAEGRRRHSSLSQMCKSFAKNLNGPVISVTFPQSVACKLTQDVNLGAQAASLCFGAKEASLHWLWIRQLYMLSGLDLAICYLNNSASLSSSRCWEDNEGAI